MLCITLLRCKIYYTEKEEGDIRPKIDDVIICNIKYVNNPYLLKMEHLQRRALACQACATF